MPDEIFELRAYFREKQLKTDYSYPEDSFKDPDWLAKMKNYVQLKDNIRKSVELITAKSSVSKDPQKSSVLNVNLVKMKGEFTQFIANGKKLYGKRTHEYFDKVTDVEKLVQQNQKDSDSIFQGMAADYKLIEEMEAWLYNRVALAEASSQLKYREKYFKHVKDDNAVSIFNAQVEVLRHTLFEAQISLNDSNKRTWRHDKEFIKMLLSRFIKTALTFYGKTEAELKAEAEKNLPAHVSVLNHSLCNSGPIAQTESISALKMIEKSIDSSWGQPDITKAFVNALAIIEADIKTCQKKLIEEKAGTYVETGQEKFSEKTVGLAWDVFFRLLNESKAYFMIAAQLKSATPEKGQKEKSTTSQPPSPVTRQRQILKELEQKLVVVQQQQSIEGNENSSEEKAEVTNTESETIAANEEQLEAKKTKRGRKSIP